MYQSFSFQRSQKVTQICYFWFENIPSGNPVSGLKIESWKKIGWACFGIYDLQLFVSILAVYLPTIRPIKDLELKEDRSQSYKHRCEQGLPDFSWHSIPKLKKYTTWPQVTKCPKLHQIAIICILQMAIEYTNLSIPRPSKIYPN
jgi:hypothetical protein